MLEELEGLRRKVRAVDCSNSPLCVVQCAICSPVVQCGNSWAFIFLQEHELLIENEDLRKKVCKLNVVSLASKSTCRLAFSSSARRTSDL